MGGVKHLLAGSVAMLLLLPGCGSREKAAPDGTPATAASASPTTTTTTTLPPPPPAWRSARWRMSKDEVLAAFPGEAQRLSQAAAFGPAAPGSTDIAIPSYAGEGATFRVLFGFEENRLGRVHMNAIKPGDATCGDVEKALTEKLGAPPAARNNTGTSLRGEETVWKHPDHTVTLSCAGVHSLGFRTVTVAYTPPG